VTRPGAHELDHHLAARITDLCDRGDQDVEQGRFDDAIVKYESALELVPKPFYAWKASAWILTALGETHFFRKDYRAAHAALTDALRCHGSVGNPFLHLRLGQVELELGNRGRARDELHRAFVRAGLELFDGEDPKYLAIIQQDIEDGVS
jgi:tetratricopeptide (TPR) repeat protein